MCYLVTLQSHYGHIQILTIRLFTVFKMFKLFRGGEWSYWSIELGNGLWLLF